MSGDGQSTCTALEDDTVGKASGAVYVYSFNGTNWPGPQNIGRVFV